MTHFLPPDGGTIPATERPLRPRRTRKKLDIVDDRKRVHVWADLPDGTRDELAKLDFVDVMPDGRINLCVTFDDGTYILLDMAPADATA